MYLSKQYNVFVRTTHCNLYDCKHICGPLFLFGGDIALFCICPNRKLYSSKLNKLHSVFCTIANRFVACCFSLLVVPLQPSVFVQILNCICPNHTIVFCTIANRFVASCLSSLVVPLQFSVLQTHWIPNPCNPMTFINLTSQTNIETILTFRINLSLC